MPPTPKLKFFENPFRYLRWAAHEKPAYFWSVVIGSMGPLSFVVVPPIQKYYGIKPPPKIPMTYPIPKGPRPRPAGFEDE